MNPVLILGGMNAALSLLEQFAPELRAAVTRGEISIEQQTVVLARIELIRSGRFFDQPQWAIPIVTTSTAPL